MGRKKRRRVSVGTIFMLFLTALVIVVCVVFLAHIAGTDLYACSSAFMASLSEQNLLEREQPQSLMTERQTPAAEERRIPEISETPQAKSGITLPTARTKTLTLAVGGTVCASGAIRESVRQGATHYDFTSVFAGLVDVLSAADLSIVTLETLTAGETLGYGSYNAPTQLLTALRDCGVDVAALATERALDKGYEGLQITLGELTRLGMAYAGVRTEENGARSTNLIGVDGVQIAVLAYTYGLSDEGKAAVREEERSVVQLMDAEQMIADITKARLDGANLVVVLPHWGAKNKQETTENMRALARTLAEAGADVILGTHPNVVQQTERLNVTRSDGLEYETVVCYSLGSLLTDARTSENTAGMIARLNITYDPVSRRTTLGELACVPLYIARQREDGENVYRIVDTDNAEAISALAAKEQEAAADAAQSVRSITGQIQREEEGQG